MCVHYVSWRETAAISGTKLSERAMHCLYWKVWISNSYGDIDIGQWKIQAPVIWLCRMTALNHQLPLETERVDGAAGRSEAYASPGTTHPQWRHADCPRPGHWTGSRAGELYDKLSLRRGRWEGHTCCTVRHSARVGTCDQPRAVSPLTYNTREDFSVLTSSFV